MGWLHVARAAWHDMPHVCNGATEGGGVLGDVCLSEGAVCTGQSRVCVDMQLSIQCVYWKVGLV
jgi:hypothetical protein